MTQATIHDILVAGVGGQGILLATDILADVFLAAGFDAKKSEVHGMAQRGGSVESHVRRHTEQVHSPLISPGQADVLLALEPLEAVRYAPMVGRGGRVIYDTRRLPPLSVSLQTAQYPEDLDTLLRSWELEVVPVPATDMAIAAGNARASNVVLLGVLSVFMEIDDEVWQHVIARRVPPKALDVNRRAFVEGQRVTRESTT